MRTKMFVFGIMVFIAAIANSCVKENEPPVAGFTVSPGSGTTSTDFVLDASASTDPENRSMSYRWDFETDGTFDTGFSSVAQVIHRFAKAGTILITLEVQDDEGKVNSTSRTVVVTVPNLPPRTPELVSPANQAIDVENATELKWTCSDPDGDALTYDVYFGKSSSPPKIGSSQETSYNSGTLDFDTQYFWKISARDSKGAVTAGPEWTFKTRKQIGPPTVTTEDATGKTATSAVVGGNVTADGGASVTERGVYWGTSADPVQNGLKVAIGSGTGSFFQTLNGLTPGATYYFAAYAINSAGKAAGTVKSFTTGTLVPVVSTSSVTGQTTTTALVGGNVESDGGATVTESGVYWGTTANPLATGTKLAIGSGTGVFSKELTGLAPGKTYFVAAYALNAVGQGSGTEISFTTLSALPVVSTNPVTAKTSTSAMLGGEVAADGGSPVTERGVYWGLSANAPVTGTKLAIGSGTGTFSMNVTGLKQGKTYYFTAYAVNKAGTSMGTELTFTTSTDKPTVTTAPVTEKTATSALVGGEVTSDGGAPVTERGVYWGTTANPQTTGNKLVIGNGTGSFSQNLTGLVSNRTYYVVAFAANSAGTALGAEYNFTTTGLVKPEVTLDSLTIAGSMTFNGYARIIDNGGSSPTRYGFIWGTDRSTDFANFSEFKSATNLKDKLFSRQNTVTLLKADQTIYIRAFAENAAGTSYSDAVGVKFIENYKGYSIPVLMTDDFSQDIGNWPILDTLSVTIKIDGGFYKLSNRQVQPSDFRTGIRFSQDVRFNDANFELESTLIVKKPTQYVSLAAIDWLTDAVKTFIYRCTAGSTTILYAGLSGTQTIWLDKTMAGIQYNKPVKLTVRKFGSNYYFFADEVLILVHTYETITIPGTFYYRIANNSEFWVDNFTFRYEGTSGPLGPVTVIPDWKTSKQ